MRTIVEFFLVIFLRVALWFRYRITVKGLDQLNAKTLKRPGGVLFLPNHATVFVDATAITLALWPKYRLRPMVVDYMYNLPIVKSVMRFIEALPVPDFSTSSNSLKRKQNERITQAVMTGLKKGDNFLIFPSGKTKQTHYEALDGASVVHRIVQEVPEVNVVLVRIKGLWGSSFSRALTGKSPPFFSTLIQGVKYVLKNLLFFTPRREVIIEYQAAPEELFTKTNRLEFNRYLEDWYNQPDGLTVQTGDHPGDSLVLVSYSIWKEELPSLWKEDSHAENHLDLTQIPDQVRKKVLDKIVELTSVNAASITPEMTLTTQLGMDSIDIAELIAFLQDQFEVSGVKSEDLTTVGRLMAIASQQIVCEEPQLMIESNLSQWQVSVPHQRVYVAEGQTIPEVFLDSCDQMRNLPAIADAKAGVMTYRQLKLRAIILAQYIKGLPGEYVGIMLPASVASTVCIFACELAGKIPLMVNWTVGSRHLQAVAELSKVQVVLTAWSFIDRLQNVDLTGIEDQLVMLEDIRGEISLFKKLKSLVLSKCRPPTVLKALGSDKLTPNHQAVLLFTSGTEGMPKGVPLSHQNILSNQRASLQAIEIFADDVLFGILPPFHSFGFTIGSILGPIAGFKVAYSPDPTDGKKLATAFEKWGVTVMCGAPTFVKAMVKSAKPKQLETMRLCITGAEKLPPELVHAMIQLGKAEGLLEGYGITECAPVLTFNPVGKPRKGVGIPLPGVELKIVTLEDHQPLPIGQQGLILAKGPNLFSGYLNPGLSSPFITLNGDRWYITGDLGYLDIEGNLTLTGRLKRFIKIGGEMVSLAAIEEVLSQLAVQKGWIASPQETAILAICAHEIAGEKPKITLFCCFDVAIDEVNQLLRGAGFSNLVKIASIVRLEEIPITGTGKINYRKLDELVR